MVLIMMTMMMTMMFMWWINKYKYITLIYRKTKTWMSKKYNKLAWEPTFAWEQKLLYKVNPRNFEFLNQAKNISGVYRIKIWGNSIQGSMIYVHRSKLTNMYYYFSYKITLHCITATNISKRVTMFPDAASTKAAVAGFSGWLKFQWRPKDWK